MNQAVQGCYDFRWSDIISGKNILHLWGIVVLLGVIAVSPRSSIVANSLDVMDRQRDQKRPAPLSQPKIQITEEGIPTDPTDGAQLTLRSLQISLRRALQNVIDEHNKSVFGNFSFYSYKKACGQKKTVRGSKNSRRLSNGTPAI